MSDTETPPAYEELFPERDEASQVVASLASLASQPPPAALLERFSSAAPHHATYFSVEKVWAEGAGYYRGNQSLAVISLTPPGSSLSVTVSLSLLLPGELDWKGRRAGQGSMVWQEAVVYSGGWERDRMEGQGSMWWGHTGNVYCGQWSGGKMHGR